MPLPSRTSSRPANTSGNCPCELTLTNHSASLMSPSDSTPAATLKLALHVLAAEQGDCAVLSYGDERREFRMVVDAGVEGTAERLKRVLEQGGTATWELLVISHIDADHIGG